MEKDKYIQITKDLYKLTLLFPKKEPLRYRLREVSIDILSDPSDKDFEILHAFLAVAKAQNWVSVSEVLAIEAGYDNLRGILKEKQKEKIEKDIFVGQPVKTGKLAAQKTAEKSERTLRQEKILDFLKTNTRAQVWEIKQIFSQVSKRTLRRDFEFLLKQGAIQRIGERNNTFYQIKSI